MIFLNFSEIFEKYDIMNQLIFFVLLLFTLLACVFIRLLNKVFNLSSFDFIFNIKSPYCKSFFLIIRWLQDNASNYSFIF